MLINPKVYWTVKRPYGNELYYPVCELSKLVCACMRVKCVKSATLARVREAGYEVVFKENPSF